MKIDLYTNAFLRSNSFSHIFARLIEEGEKQNIEIIKRTNTEILASVQSSFPNFDELSMLNRNAIFWDKDMYLAKFLESQGIRLFNSQKAIEICDDKGLTHLALSGVVPMPETYLSPKTYPSFTDLDYSFFDDKIERLGFPVIIKQSFGSFGNEVFLCNTLNEAHDIIRSFGTRPFLIQKFIQTSIGKDVRVYVVGGKTIGGILRESDSDFRANVARGGKATNYSLPDTFKEVAEKAARTIGLDFCGVDILFGENGEPILCEVNSNAHFTGFEEATGINVAEKIISHIKKRSKRVIEV